MQSNTHSCDESSNTTSSNHRASSIGSLLRLNQPDVYLCSRCSRGFPSSQSLGGHQNAHRRERNAERRQMMEERKLTLEKIKKTEMTILSTQSTGAISPPPPPPPPTNNGDFKPHFGIRLDELAPDYKGILAGLKSFLDFQAQRPPLPASASMADANNHVHELPDHDDDKTLHKKMMPWELNLGAENDDSNDQEVPDTGVGVADMKEKEESDEVTCKKVLDLNLKL